ncbi:MAG TPA: hypothetical protein VHE35_30780 [Kofleriaceae bacterium]|nr:hypothetical protein [Kofleriaceae bacterium]
MSEAREAREADARRDAEREAQASGRARMLAIWRAAVACVTEAAQREATARQSLEAGDAGHADEEAESADATPTWSFPPKVRAAS